MFLMLSALLSGCEKGKEPSDSPAGTGLDSVGDSDTDTDSDTDSDTDADSDTDSDSDADVHVSWSHRYGGTSDQESFVVTTDLNNNLYLSNYVSGTIDFGNGIISGSDTIVLAELDPSGNAVWSKGYPNGGHQYPHGLGVNSAGNLMVAGSFESTLKFGAPAPDLSSKGTDDFFVAGISGAGTTLWAKSFGDANVFQKFTSLAIAVDDNPVMTGWLTGNADFGGGTLSGNNVDIVVVKLDKAAGAHIWSHVYGDPGYQQGHKVVVDSSGNVIVVGYMDGSVNFGGGAIGNGHSLFLLKLDANGNYLWAKAFPTTTMELKPHRVAVDAAGNIFLAGPKLGDVNFGGGTLKTVGGYDLYVARFDASGNHVWSKSFGDQEDQWADDLTVDQDGNLLLVGSYSGTLDLGGVSMTSNGGDEFGGDVFLAKLSPDGVPIYAHSFGDAERQYPKSVAVDHDGAILVSGAFAGNLDFGDGPLTSAGGLDLFVAKFQE